MAGLLSKSEDFCSVSGCRDLFFNVMEHRFTIPAIADFLSEHALRFHGFEVGAEPWRNFGGNIRPRKRRSI